MSHKQIHEPVRSRNEPFVERTATRIWAEDASTANPYIASAARCHGYDLIELMSKRSVVDVFYLLFRGELPSNDDAQVLQHLMIGLMNPGPRHPATQAAMNAGVGKTDPVHILPIATAVLGGKHKGGGGIEDIMRFLRKQQHTDPRDFAAHLATHFAAEPASTGTTNTAATPQLPGFGREYGGIDLLTADIAKHLLQLKGAGKALRWGCALADILKPFNIGWLTTGIAAAVFADLGFQPRAGGALFQLLGAPGLLAHGLELANKPITAMPFVSDENYVIER
jgi:citrate synthase